MNGAAKPLTRERARLDWLEAQSARYAAHLVEIRAGRVLCRMTGTTNAKLDRAADELERDYAQHIADLREQVRELREALGDERDKG